MKEKGEKVQGSRFKEKKPPRHPGGGQGLDVIPTTPGWGSVPAPGTEPEILDSGFRRNDKQKLIFFYCKAIQDDLLFLWAMSFEL